MTTAKSSDRDPALHSVLPTVAEALVFDSLSRGRAEVVAGATGLDRRLRWAHISELPTIADVLRGGELIITTGIALPEDEPGLAQYVYSLAKAGAVGLVVGLGPRFVTNVPGAMLRVADQQGFPLILLRRFTRFIEITEDIHSRIVDAQVEELRAADEIHKTFTELAVEGSPIEGVVRHVAKMSASPVVLENLVHQVLAYDTAGRPVEDVIDDWEARSRAVHVSARTAHDGESGWLVGTVGARGRDWGRLILLEPGRGRRLDMLVERAAITLALGRLVERDLNSMNLHVHGKLLAGLLSPDSPNQDLALEAKALGVPLDSRRTVGVAVRLRGAVIVDPVQHQVRLRALADAASRAARSVGSQALVGLVEGNSIVAVLLSLPKDRDLRENVTRWVNALAHLAADEQYVVGVGSPAHQASEARRSLVEATQVSEAGLAMDDSRPFLQSADLRLRGLLQVLRGNLELQTFAEHELGPLLEHDRHHGTTLVAVLRSYLECGRNKTAAAEHAHVSRPWMYERLARVERVLDVDLDSEEACVSLQVAIMAWDAMRR
ncbi:MAG: PucR family transcriptional regulator ligand-binding domain-containing protein [Nocardioides sp.]